MERKIFIFILYLVQILRSLLGPLIILIAYPLSKKVRERLLFENKNFDKLIEPQRVAAFLAIEVSSEGEFEQIRPLIDHLLEKNHIIEVIYASPSLEEKMVKLESKTEGLRTFRLPVLSFGLSTNHFLLSQNINSFLTAPRLILCRYDFYPELLLYGAKEKVHFSLVSATLKNKGEPSLFLKNVYKSFNYILAATEKDEKLLKHFISPETGLSTYEFRVLQIISRINKKEGPLSRIADLVRWIKEVEPSSRIVFGSAWANEMDVFQDKEFSTGIKNNELRVVVLPHETDPKIKESIKNVKAYTYKDGEDCAIVLEQLRKEPGVLILDIRGLLCELYSLFGHSFVGGGHGRSVHSVLEPFFNGCHIYCGPKVHRSTEIDFIRGVEPEALSVVESLVEFYGIYKNQEIENKTEPRHRLGQALYSEFEEKVSLLIGKKKND